MNISAKLNNLLRDKNISGICYGETLRNLKVNEVKKHFPISLNTNVIGLINCSVIGPFKYGIVITDSGLVWKNNSHYMNNNLNWQDLSEIKKDIKLDNFTISFSNYGEFDMKNSTRCLPSDALSLFHDLSELSNNNFNKEDDKTLFDNKLYCNLIAKMLALFIVADGIIKVEQIELAEDIINNEHLIENKEESFYLIKETIDEILELQNKSHTLYQLKINSLINEVLKINNQSHKDRLMIILEGMSKNTVGFGEMDSSNLLDLIKSKLI